MKKNQSVDLLHGPIFKSLSEKVSITKDQLRRVSEEQLKAYMEEKPVSEKDKYINL